MKVKTDISQQTALRTHLSPQQVRFVRLLEMSGPEIEEVVRNELDDNPALEAKDEELPAPETDSFEGEGDSYDETSEQMQAADYGNEDDIPAHLLHPSGNNDEDGFSSWIEQHRNSPSLIDSLNEQLDFIDAPPRDIAIARYLLGYLDDNGRLSRSLNDIADDISIATGATVTRKDLIPALDIIRYQLDPPGLGAVDLRECLLIQLRRRQPKTLAVRAAQEIIEDNFDLFTKKHLDKLKSVLGVDKEVVDEALDIIRSLDPKPGGSQGDAISNRLSHITPDFFVESVDGEPGRFSVTLNQRLPELAVEQSFLVEANDKTSRKFIRSKRDEANTFISLIKRRSDTLLAVMKAIVTIQHKFFETEDSASLRPMILNDINDLTGFDRSVISRATSNKYVATPGGVYPLKMFFNDTPTEDADTSSSEIVAELKKIIDGEDKKRPLSDRVLTDMLNEKGYGLARRTVTKYREKNNIPVARLRKEY